MYEYINYGCILNVFNTLCGTISELWLMNGLFPLEVMVLFLVMRACMILLTSRDLPIHIKQPLQFQEKRGRGGSSLTSKLYWQLTFSLFIAEISIVVLVLLNSGLNWRKQFWNLALGASKARLRGEQLMNRLQAEVWREMLTCHRKALLALLLLLFYSI